jgi:hypothetical protein
MNIHGKDIYVDKRLVRIARLAAEQYEFVDDPGAMVAGLLESGIRIDLFTFIQKLSQREHRYEYPMEYDNLAVLPVSTFDNWWKNQISGKTRNMARRAEKCGVVVREIAFDDALVAGISTIYNETPMRQGKRFWHFGKDIEAVRAENGTFLERSVFIGAFFEDSLIGYAKLVSDENREQAGLMQILSMIGHRDKAPTNALITQAVRSCAERGIKNLVYSKFAYGSKQRDSLSDFKQHNGFERVDLPRYYVPCSMAGKAAFRLGLHHGIKHFIPEPALVQLRHLRSIVLNRQTKAI